MGKIGTGNPDQFDGKNPWVSGEDCPNKTNPLSICGNGSKSIVPYFGWMNIHKSHLFYCSSGYRVLTRSHVCTCIYIYIVGNILYILQYIHYTYNI